MNARKRFHRIMTFEPVDRVPLMEIEAYDRETIKRWRKEGLAANQSPREALGMDGAAWVPVDFFTVPAFEPLVLEENDRYTIAVNSYGATVRRPKDQNGYSYEGFVEHPVKNHEDWLRYKERLDPDTPGRFGDKWGPELWDKLNSSDEPVGLLMHPFFFRLGLYAMGLENFLVGFYKQPDLLHEMFEHCAQMSIGIVEKVSARVKLDYCCIAEDMAFKHAPHISPDMYREFWSPHQPAVITGRDMRYVGNIGIRAVAEGKDAIDREIETKVIPMLDKGGYIPTLDDEAPPEISWNNYSYYINRLKEL
jgi:hypothetical protein